MNPYTAQVIGGNIGQFLQSRGKDARRERMLRLIQMDNEQKKLASFLEEQKRQQDARDAAAQAAQAKIAEQNQIRDAQEKMRLEVLQRLTPTETVAGPMAAIPGALAALEEAARVRAGIPREGQEGTPDTLDTSQGLGVWSPGEEPMPRPKFMKGPQMGPIIEGQQEFPPMGESPTPLSLIGREEAQAVQKGMDPDMAAFYRSEFQGSRPEDLDTLAREFKKDMWKSAPKDKMPAFINRWFKPDERPDTSKFGGFDIVYPAQNIDNETLKFFADKDGIKLTDEEIENLRKKVNIVRSATPTAGSSSSAPPPPKTGMGLTPPKGGFKFGEIPGLPGGGPGGIPGFGDVVNPEGPPPNVEPGSPDWNDWLYRKALEDKKEAEETATEQTAAQQAAQLAAVRILKGDTHGYSPEKRRDDYLALVQTPEKWDTLDPATQQALTAKYKELERKVIERQNKSKGGADTWESLNKDQKKKKRDAYFGLLRELNDRKNFLNDTSGGAYLNFDLKTGKALPKPIKAKLFLYKGKQYSPSEFEAKTQGLTNELLQLEEDWGRANLSQLPKGARPGNKGANAETGNSLFKKMKLKGQ